MKEIVIATRNEKKLKEIKRLFRNSDIKAIPVNNFSNVPEVIENGTTFQQNAVKKAYQTSKFLKRLVLADDSGLQVFALNSKPGVHSSRYAGPEKRDLDNNIKLLKALKNKSKRSAQFKCVIAIADSGRLIKVIEGVCKGSIGFKIQGKTGFGYDPVFIPHKHKKTFSELGPEIKDKLSHRSQALKKAKTFIQVNL